MEIVRGTTPTIRFKLPFETNKIRKCEIYFGQPELLFTKTEADCQMEDTRILCTLTQTETLQLVHKLTLRMQIRYELDNGRIGATKIVTGDVEEIMKDGEFNVGD